MINRRRRLRFAPEALERRGIAGHIFGKELQRHPSFELRVLRLIHDAHAAAAQFLEHAVMRDRAARK
jgi:hypothetical protein